MAAGAKAEAFARDGARAADEAMIDTYRRNGVEIVFLSEEEAESWRQAASASAYETFKQEVPAGAVLLDLAGQVK
jgi:TRAP-type C4-dicarboxylate transport system substrate-binding protein